MRLLGCLVLGLLLLLIQGILHRVGLPSWIIPQGLIACVVFLAFYECSLLGVVTAFILGIFIDMSAGVIVGPWAGAYVVVYAFFVFLSQRLFVDSALVSMVVVGVASLLAGAVFLSLAFEYQAVSREDVLMLLGQAGASALFAPIIFRILVRVWKRGSSASTRRGSVISAV